MAGRKDLKGRARDNIVALFLKHDLDYEYSEDENGYMVLTAFGMNDEVMRELVSLQVRYRLVREVRVGTNYVAFHA